MATLEETKGRDWYSLSVCVLMETLWRGRLGVLHRTSFCSYADLIRPWSFRVNMRFSSANPSPGGRTNHFPPFTVRGRCIYEEPKEEKAGWCPDWVANAAWDPCCTSGSCFQPVVVLYLVTSPYGLALSDSHSFLEAGVPG